MRLIPDRTVHKQDRGSLVFQPFGVNKATHPLGVNKIRSNEKHNVHE